MDSIMKHVSPESTRQRLLSPKQFDILVSSEGVALNRLATSVLDIKLMYSSLYVFYLDLCKTCAPSSQWTVSSNIEFVTKADNFVSHLEVCIHKGVPRSKIMRDAIVLMIGLGAVGTSSGTTGTTGSTGPQDWDNILGGKFFDWVAYRSSCIGNEIIKMTDEMYYSLVEGPTSDLMASTRDVLLVPLSDLTNVAGYESDLMLARTCYSISHRVRSIFRGEESRMRDIARVLEAVLLEWVCGQSC
ncbi:unnamed protein product [Pylaiella littoralis]